MTKAGIDWCIEQIRPKAISNAELEGLIQRAKDDRDVFIRAEFWIKAAFVEVQKRAGEFPDDHEEAHALNCVKKEFFG